MWNVALNPSKTALVSWLMFPKTWKFVGSNLSSHSAIRGLAIKFSTLVFAPLLSPNTSTRVALVLSSDKNHSNLIVFGSLRL